MDFVQSFFNCILPIFVFEDNTAFPGSDVGAILLSEPLVLFFWPVHFDWVSIFLNVHRISHSRSHLLFLESWFPVTQACICPDYSHLLICILIWMKHRKTNSKLFPQIINFDIFVVFSYRNHFIKNFIIQYRYRGQYAKVRYPVYSALPIEQLLIETIYEHIFVLEYALTLVHEHRALRHPYMILGPF